MTGSRHLEAREAEQAVLGAILFDNAVFDQVAEIVSEDDFYAPRNRIIFEHMMALADKNQPIDHVSLTSVLEKSGNLEESGGVDYIMQLDQLALTTVNVEHHAKRAHELAEVRRLISACSGIVDTAHKGDYEDGSALMDLAQQVIYEVGSKMRRGSFLDMPTALQMVIERVQSAFKDQSGVTGTPTGFIDLDRKTAGFQPGDLIILAARPAMGKTALALNFASCAASLGKKSVAIFSLEMPTNQLAARMLSCESRVDSEKMRSGHLAEGDIDRLLQGVKRMNDWSVFIDDTPGATVMEIRSKCRRLASDRNHPDLGLVVIDYLQLMQGKANRSREQEISEISRSLKGLAKELNVPIMALSQLNRGVESRPNKRPMISDLRESGAIEQDADVILFVYRDEYYHEDSEDKGLAEVIIGKQRNGPIGKSKLKFFKEWSRFDNLQIEE